MRMRVMGAAVVGALALSAFAVPAAQADEVHGDTKISNVVVNGGKAVVVGSTGTKTIPVSFTVTDNSGVSKAEAILYHGTDLDHSDTGAIANTSDGSSKCTKVNATTSTCTATYTLDTDFNLLNSTAGTWKVAAVGQGKDGNYVVRENAKTFQVQRASRLSANASPEPVKKGRTITVTGALTRANWDAHKYSGYAAQPVKLQFRKKGSSTYSTLKTVKTDSRGNLKTTTKATADGYYRFVFAGTSTTPAVTAAGDFIDVK
ncbi:DUF5707 domain-containing protein [Streptomyces sp. NPDC086787]|uniref:DUF5707 domain-containing protein n=1 Tax=Streptomyces sp. NPDC086787 TaxID=3365759 RepID=UPI003824BD61